MEIDMVAYHFKPMTKQYASIISHWKYNEPYSIYSMDGSIDCINDLMNGEYFYVLDDSNNLVGFICSGNSARVFGGYESGIYNNESLLDIGLGLHPDATGKGRGLDFLLQSVGFLSDRFQVLNIQLVVAVFNERAIKVYERAGFTREFIIKSKIDEKEIDFLVMRLSITIKQLK
jgi:[ribosomal protein S18]-alanine N-acetyltransferase